MILVTGIVWLKLIFIIGDLNYNIAIFAFALQRIALSLQGFFITTVLFGLSFAHMLNSASIWEDNYCAGQLVNGKECRFSTQTDIYYDLFRDLFTRGYLLRDQDYWVDYRLTFVLIIFFLVLVELILLNVLIAQTCSSFSEANNRGKQAFWRHRLHLIKELNNFYDPIGCKNTTDDKNGFKSAEEFDDNPNKLSSGRFFLSTAHLKHFPGDFHGFRKWWIKNGPPPNPCVRLRYFFTWADMQEILLPGTTFERIISGGDKDSNSISSRVLLYLLLPVTIAVQVMIFLSGLVSCSYLWPDYMKKYIFEGKIEPLIKLHNEAQLESVHINVERILSELRAQQFVIKNMEEDIQFIGRRVAAMIKVQSAAVYEDADELSNQTTI